MAKADINRSELAELTGYSVEQIVSWERGRARMYPIELVKLCHALDVKPEWLLCWERFLAQNISSSRIAKTPTHALADVAKRHCAARVHHSAELRALEGDNLFDTLTTYRAVAERARGTPRSCSVRCARASLASKLRCCLI